MLGTDISKKLHLNSVKGLDMRKRIHAVTHRCGIRQPNTFNGQCIAYCRLISGSTFEKQWWILWVVLKRLDVAMNARVSIIWNRVIQMRFVTNTHPLVKKGLIHHNFVGPCHLHFWSWKSISIESSSNFPHFDSDELTQV